MTELKTFEFMPGMSLRVTGDAENPWFVAKDVCDVLGIANAPQAVGKLDEAQRNTVYLADGKRVSQETAAISKSGLYALAMKSRKPETKAFRKWVTSMVLPAIQDDDKELTQAEDEIVQAAMHILHRRVQERTARAHGMDTETA